MAPISTKDLDLYKKKAPEEFTEGPSMPLLKHLEELREKVFVSLIAFIVCTFVGFYYSELVINVLTNIAPGETIFLQIKPGEFFFTSLRVSFHFGFALSLPVVIWQLSTFAFPGLNEDEKKVAVPLMVTTPFLFSLGTVFAYLFVAPSMLSFLFGFGKDLIASSISIESYISFTLMILAICGFSFLMPIAILGLAMLGLTSSDFLYSQWKYAVLISACLGAVLTPTPDPFNMSLISGILIALYFISVGILKLIRK